MNTGEESQEKHIGSRSSAIPAPYGKFLLLREKIGLGDNEFRILNSYSGEFIKRKQDFSEYFYHFFLEIPETRMFLIHYGTPGFLRRAWANWFEALFRWDGGEEFLSYLWRIGERHVQVNLDQRFSNLAFSAVRQFCERVILSDIPEEEKAIVSRAMNRLIDFCLLVETDAYIGTHSRCDMEIVRGVADRVRNKITVIGGNIKRLQRKISEGDPLFEVYESVLRDSSTCERMIIDIRVFSDMSQRAADISKIVLKDLIEEVIEKLSRDPHHGSVAVRFSLDKDTDIILGDRKDMESMFYYLIENSFEAADEKDPLLIITTIKDASLPHRIKVEIFNTGIPPRADEIEKLFTPFFSTKPLGTGFGLSIASLAARKNYATLAIEPVTQKGTKAVIVLPLASGE